MAEEFGPYLLQELIGRGGMGEVWRAYDTGKERTVAVKRLRSDQSDDPRFEARFRRESTLAGRLHAPNVLSVLDYGEIDGRLFLTMPLVDGRDLATVLAGGRLSPDRTSRVITQVASALDAAHAAGLVHRDVKPSNVLIDRNWFAYLVDFGIAKPLEAATALTNSADVVGTIGYVAPERLLGSGGGPPADVYSLACVLYECLAGRPPYTGTSYVVAYAHQHAPPPRLSDVDPRLAVVDPVLARGMVKQPAGRFASAGELAGAAAAALARAQSPPPPPPSRPLAGEVPAATATGPPAAFGAAARGTRRHPVLSRSSRRRNGPLLVAVALAVGAVTAGALALSGAGTDPTGGPSPGPETPTAASVYRRIVQADVGGSAQSVVLSPDGTRATVLTVRTPGTDDLYVIDTADGTRDGPTPVSKAGGGLAASPDGAVLYVPRCDGDGDTCRLDRVDPASGALLGGTRTDRVPTTVAVAPDGLRAYVLVFRPPASARRTDLVTVDLRTQTALGAPLRVPSSGTGGLAVSGDGRRVVVADGRSSVSVLDTASGTLLGPPITVGGQVSDVAVDADGRRAFVTGSDAVTVIDLDTGARAGPPIPVGRGAGAIALLPDGRAVVANRSESTVRFVDVAAGRVDGAPVPVGQEPVDVAVSADGSRIAVLSASGTVTVLGT